MKSILATLISCGLYVCPKSTIRRDKTSFGYLKVKNPTMFHPTTTPIHEQDDIYIRTNHFSKALDYVTSFSPIAEHRTIAIRIILFQSLDSP